MSKKNIEQYISYKSKAINIPPRVNVISVIDDIEGFRIIFENEQGGKFYKIYFEYVMNYRKSREGERSKSLGQLFENNDGSEGILYQVKNSSLIEWFDNENLGAKEYYLDPKFRHWAIIALNDWIDVLSYVEPEVINLSNGE